MFTRKPLCGLPRTALASSVTAILCAGTMHGAYAQEPDDDNEQARDQDVIIVTGTRIRRDDFTSPNATVVVTSDDMANLGLTSAAEMIEQLPSNIADNTPQVNADSSWFAGANIANLRGLNTSQGTRTLVLLDSRRFPATNNGGSVDLNVIPSALIGRIETVTGGASATYGADALAGVVNVVLDRNIEDIRVNLSYENTAENDAEFIDFSLGTGFELFDGRGSVQIGYDHSDQEGIQDCTTREFCRNAFGIINNGTAGQGTSFQIPYEVRNTDVTDPTQPQYLITRGMRYTTPTTGLIWDDINGDPNPPYYTFNEAGNDIIEIYSADSELCGPALTQQQLDFLVSEGATDDTPFGCGRVTGAGEPLIPDNQRDNLFVSFRYELEGGIEIDTDIQLSRSDSFAYQNGNGAFDVGGLEVFPENAFLQLASPAMQQALLSRMEPDIDTPSLTFFGDFFGTNDPTVGCAPAPYVGHRGFGQIADDEACYVPQKDWRDEINRQNTNTTDVMRWSFGAQGDLFDEGNWTWDGYVSLGKTENRRRIDDWASSNRKAMAIDSLLDNNGNPVCRVLYSADGMPAYNDPELADPNFDPNDTGDVHRQRWLSYFDEVLGTDDDAAERRLYLDTLANGCAPLNPFGHGMSPESRAYAFPTVYEGSDITQHALSMTFSGDIWQGFGAGPMRMAAGIDANEQETENLEAPNAILQADFALNFGGTWSGITTNSEAFAEFELPLLRDMTAAEYLMINFANRRVQNESRRTAGGAPTKITRYTSSWKMSMVWQPVDFMNLRVTRSQDTRAPSSRELFATFNPSATTASLFDFTNPFLPDDPNVMGDTIDEAQWAPVGGNADLREEKSITETVGLVFTPGGALDGLQVSVDYNQLALIDGIEAVSVFAVPNRCKLQIDIGLPPEQQTYCSQITFGAPILDESDPYAAYSNFEIVNASQENAGPYFTRSIDYSVNYLKQLAGGGSLNSRVLITRYLEQRRLFDSSGFGDGFTGMNIVGQTGSNGVGNIFGSLGINYSPVPEIRGNLWLTYQKNAFSITSQVIYTGSGRLNLQDGWIMEGEVGEYRERPTPPPGQFAEVGNISGQIGDIVYVPYAPELENTVTDSTLPSWATLNVNLSYDFSLSSRSPDRFDSLEAYLNITNIGDRIPYFFSGNDAGQINATYFSAMGRQYELGVRMRF